MASAPAGSAPAAGEQVPGGRNAALAAAELTQPGLSAPRRARLQLDLGPEPAGLVVRVREEVPGLGEVGGQGDGTLDGLHDPQLYGCDRHRVALP
jgi:hypothetical protein